MIKPAQTNDAIVHRKITKTMLGTMIKLNGCEYIVMEVHENYVRCKNITRSNAEKKYNVFECFTLGDLVQLGMEDSFPSVENSYV